MVEVVVALGIVAIAVLAILGIAPASLTTSRSAQDETRATQIADNIISSLAGQATTNFANASIVQPSPSPGFQYSVPLNRDFTYNPLGATNEGSLVANYTKDLPYQITLTTKQDPNGFDRGFACQVTVRVAWQPVAQNYREYVRIISKY